MNLLDLGILIVLLLVGLRGYYRGLFQELSVIVGLLGGLLVAAHLYLRLAHLFQPWINNPLYCQILAFITILIAVYWLTRILGHLLQRVLARLYLGGLDRWLGCLFGLAKGMLILGFLLTASQLVIPHDSQLLKESRTAPYLRTFFFQAVNLLPADFKAGLTERARILEKQWGQPAPPADPAEESE
ncbi:MAG: CvpA family protein [Deltaproteobacteria bacterium]|nr:CvpA family protein [Deltaproteobacteria bacterium]MBW1952282.1 CvpA family protein [Deltaproteobacteria bacterium]MBW1987053.1 CvpA family protein [Deltaproteobacteria bacterium]MBW2133989.1 CvpA family protein [Deltaproteobacteria bacterium]